MSELIKNVNINEYQGIIFDLDGTLVDSSIAIEEVLTGWCKKHDISLPMLLERCHGKRIIDFLPDIAPQLNGEKEAKYLADLEAITTTGLIEITGAKTFLEHLDNEDITWAIATSGTYPVASLRLATCGMPIPKVFVTSEQVEQGKPDPSPFLLAAKKLGLSAKHCLAFEDSNNGIKSAIAAGCDVVVIGEDSSISHDKVVGRVNNYASLLSTLQLDVAVSEAS